MTKEKTNVIDARMIFMHMRRRNDFTRALAGALKEEAKMLDLRARHMAVDLSTKSEWVGVDWGTESFSPKDAS